MNKITSILAGVATVACVSVAPAFAQGALTFPGSSAGNFFTITSAPGAASFSATGQATYNPLVGAATTALFNLSGTRVDSSTVFNITSFTFTPSGGAAITEGPTSGPGGAGMLFTVTPLAGSNVAVSSVGNFADGTNFNFVGGAPVPETSTVVSFGALLALGGLVVAAKRKKAGASA